MCDSHQHHGHANADEPRIVPLASIDRRDLVRGLWAGTMLIGVGGAVAGCETVSQAFEPSDADLAQMSAQAWTEVKAKTPISRDARGNQRLQTIGSRIARASGLPITTWEYVLFDSPEKNAWVLPSGKVGFYKGLMDFCENDDQVAAVLGHEVGHVARRHAAKRAGRESATQLGLAGINAAIGSRAGGNTDTIMGVLGAGASVGVILPFSRENESEADRIGVDYMKTAGYDVKAAVRLWERMAAASANRGAEWMSTHPDPGRRAQELKGYITSRGYATF